MSATSKLDQDRDNILSYTYIHINDPFLLKTLDFDTRLMRCWNDLMERGSFRYNLDTRRDRQVPGRRRYLAQYQPCRARLRRKPEAMMELRQEPDPSGFNFTKVDHTKELVFQVKNLDRGEEQQGGKDVLLINVSPIDPGHCLLVPSLESRHGQVLTRHSIILALEVLCLSTNHHLRLAFNSLCAYASVNHLHWHTYYLHHTLEIQCMSLSLVTGPLFTWTQDQYPAQGWCFLLPCLPSSSDLNTMANHVFLLTNWLTDTHIAHNVYICRGAGREGGEGTDWTRVIVWARQSVIGAKDPGDFVMAVCELSGQILVYEEQHYHTLQEEEVEQAQLASVSTVYKRIENDVKQLFEEYE